MRFNIALDTKQVILETLFEANLLASVVFVAAAVSMSMGGCRAVATVSLLPATVADVAIAAEPTVL